MEWGPINVARCYFLPHLNRGKNEEALESLRVHHQMLPPIIVGGDFNAHAME